jgi:hypothetical protein
MKGFARQRCFAVRVCVALFQMATGCVRLREPPQTSRPYCLSDELPFIKVYL